LNFGKPDLDLIEPTGIGRGVMDPYGWIGLEEVENILGRQPFATFLLYRLYFGC
jgi:hypothetical protein